MLEKEGSIAKVDFGNGVVRTVNVSLVDVKVDEYVIVHAGFAIQVLDKKAADEALDAWNELLSLENTLDSAAHEPKKPVV